MQNGHFSYLTLFIYYEMEYYLNRSFCSLFCSLAPSLPRVPSSPSTPSGMSWLTLHDASGIPWMGELTFFARSLSTSEMSEIAVAGYTLESLAGADSTLEFHVSCFCVLFSPKPQAFRHPFLPHPLCSFLHPLPLSLRSHPRYPYRALLCSWQDTVHADAHRARFCSLIHGSLLCLWIQSHHPGCC